MFSGIVGIFGVQALHALSPYKKHKHPDIAQQRFPDLSLSGKLNPPRSTPWNPKGRRVLGALQSHYNHPGWYIVWRYAVDQTKRLKLDKMVAIWRVDIAFLREEDWKYEASTAGTGGGGRTHTFGLKRAATKLKNAAVYQRKDVRIIGGKAVPANGD